MLLATLIAEYEKSILDLPEADPVELIKIRLDDFGYKPSDLANAYGDKGTISKVLNDKQTLSLTMIRKFSDFLKLPVGSLIKEYKQVKDRFLIPDSSNLFQSKIKSAAFAQFALDANFS